MEQVEWLQNGIRNLHGLLVGKLHLLYGREEGLRDVRLATKLLEVAAILEGDQCDLFRALWNKRTEAGKGFDFAKIYFRSIQSKWFHCRGPTLWTSAPFSQGWISRSVARFLMVAHKLLTLYPTGNRWQGNFHIPMALSWNISKLSLSGMGEILSS